MKIKKSNRLLFLLSILTVILVVCQIFLSNNLLDEGLRLKDVQAEISRIESENQELKNKIAMQTKLSDLAEFAEKNGFIKDPPLINLSQKIPVAAIK